MGLFSKKTQVVAPCNGQLKPLEKVNDPVFSKGLAGKGFAVMPSENEIVSSVEGEVTMVFPTGHAFGVKDKKGWEYLIHMGLDTVTLKGEGFETKVKVGQHLRKGDVVSYMDLNLMKEKGLESDVLVLVTNSGDMTMKVSYGKVEKGQVVAEVNHA
ncbi:MULTISPECIES: PTS glucose transporter subunit IIA [Terrabacteria group]|uniref:PTS sugar transporter subunit IIA n=1 Tax=Bacillati TaxID=1783272 RepID=UPI00193A9383|nr:MULTISPECIES: PTS glucose transporter subunit IIA [Terrabacteria group]MBW9212273.1 PTS glucose transporter subunit IIA [Trueperella sp. zg.1013]QRG86187.1 PTS glucose transporter subunit IIA [Bulleidia sp. zg-1006]